MSVVVLAALAACAAVGLLIAIGDEKVDVTTDFIAFYNARPANTPAKP